MKVKRLISSFLITLCIISTILAKNGINVYANENNDLSQNISLYSDSSNKRNFNNYINEISKQLPLFMNIVNGDSNSEFAVGNEIRCYNLDTNERVYYYPIFLNNTCTLMANRTDNSEISLSTDVRVYNQLNSIKTNEDTYLLIIYDGKLFIEGQNEKITLVDYSS